MERGRGRDRSLLVAARQELYPLREPPAAPHAHTARPFHGGGIYRASRERLRPRAGRIQRASRVSSDLRAGRRDSEPDRDAQRHHAFAAARVESGAAQRSRPARRAQLFAARPADRSLVHVLSPGPVPDFLPSAHFAPEIGSWIFWAPWRSEILRWSIALSALVIISPDYDQS